MISASCDSFRFAMAGLIPSSGNMSDAKTVGSIRILYKVGLRHQMSTLQKCS